MRNLLNMGATALGRAISKGEVTARETMEVVLERISHLNPQLNAIVTLDPERCRALSLEADRAVEHGDKLGPLHGVPITVKDNFAVAGMRTTAGHPPLRDNVPTMDAAVVARLRAAGAIVIGKSNMPELASDLQTNNDLFGRTSNPWDTNRTPGGSSGGEAAAVASGISFLGLGNDLLVSVRLPAHYCGVFSYLPTAGLLPISGFTPDLKPAGALKHMLRPGFLARSVEDLSTATYATAGPIPEEPWMPPADALRHRPVEEAPSITSLRCVVCTNAGKIPASRQTTEAVRRFAADIAAAGAAVTEIQGDVCDHSRAGRVWTGLFSHAVGQALPPSVRFFAGIGSRTLNPSLRDYHELEAGREATIMEVDRHFVDADILLAPVSATPAFHHTAPTKSRGPRKSYGPLDVDGSPYPYAGVTSAFGFCYALTGHPVATLPIARSSEGLPIGIQAIGRRWDDRWFLRALAVMCRERVQFEWPPIVTG
jgi:amidase